MLDAWLDAFNSGERARLEAFRDRYLHTFDVDGMLDFRRQTGGFVLLRREPAAPGSAQALVQEADSETVARIAIVMGKDRQPMLDVQAIERPADLAIARLDQAGAVAALAAKADAEQASTTLAASRDKRRRRMANSVGKPRLWRGAHGPLRPQVMPAAVAGLSPADDS